MQTKLKAIFESDPANLKCCDCRDELHDPWASLNHAVFICINCSGVHRGFGPMISFVRSTSLG